MGKGIFILVFAILLFGCTKHENLFDEGKTKEEAEKNFPVQNIDPNQDWVMATSRTLDVTLNEKAGETYTIKVFDGYPFDTENDVRLLAQKDVKDGEPVEIKFDAPIVLKHIYVMRQLGKDYVIRVSTIKNERFSVTFGKNEDRSARGRSVVRAIDTSKYTTIGKGAKRIKKGSDLKELEGGSWYIDSEIYCKEEISLAKGACLYIKDGGSLTVKKLKMKNSNSFVSVLEGGHLTIKDDFELEPDKDYGFKQPAFYNAGTVIAEDVDLKKCLWINEGSFTAEDFDVDEGVEVWNHCRLIITGENDDDDDDDDEFTIENATFYNEGYVKVNKGGAEWEKSVLHLAGNAVFDIAGKLVIKDYVRLSAITSTTTLVAAYEVVFGDNDGDEDDDDKGYLDTVGTINISCTIPVIASDNIGNIDLQRHTIIDTNECTVHSDLNPVPDKPLAVTTYGFEDTVGKVTDYDFNDVVLHVSNPKENKITVTLIAAGATKPIYVQYSLDNGNNYTDLSFNEEKEVHAAFGKPVTEMINTITVSTDLNFPKGEVLNVPDGFSFATNGRIRIVVDGNTQIDSYNDIGGVPYSLSVPVAWEYPTERIHIDQVYKEFVLWTQDKETHKDWYMHKAK